MTISITFNANDTDYVDKLNALIAAVNAIAAGAATFGVSTTLNFQAGLTEQANGSNARVLAATGEQTLPLQPAFFATNGGADANVTGDGTDYIIICDTEVFDQNADYAAGTGIFTAPVTGRYLFTGIVALSSVGAGHTSGAFYVDTSNRTYDFTYLNWAAIAAAGDVKISGGHIVDMDAGDTAKLRIKINSSTKTVGVTTDSKFGGALIC